MDIVKLVQPGNLHTENERFLSSKRYNPRLSYAWEGRERIERWLGRQPWYRGLVEAILAQDHLGIMAEAKQVFQVELDDGVLAGARADAGGRTVPVSRVMHGEAVRMFEAGFRRLGLNDYRLVVVDAHGFNFRPQPSTKRILMSRHTSFDLFSLEGEVRHELLHAVRHENGKFNGILQSPDYLPTDEGLASYAHDYGGNESNNSLKQHAAEYAVTKVMLEGSLREGYDYLRDLGFSEELAWQRAVRHKFGFVDTSQPGDIMKPAMYYYWEQRVKSLTSEERLRLMVGKISLGELSEYPEYRGVVAEERLGEVLGI